MGWTLLIHLIFVIVVPILAEIEMEFTKYPESVTAPVGDEVTFECAVRVPGERLAWRWRPDNDLWTDWNNVAGTNDKDSVSTRLVVQIKEDTPTALYQCIVWYGSIILVSIPARLSIAKIDLRKNTQERRVITAPLHNTVVLHCKEPLSEPPARLSWWKETSAGARKSIETPNGVLVINNATIEDSGTYGCTATNDISDQTVDLPERTYLKVQHEGHDGLRFLESPEYVGTVDKEGVLTVPVAPDDSMRLWCGLVGTPPPRIEWSKGTDIIPGNSHSLVVEQFSNEHEGIYSCSANGIRRLWKVIALQPPHWEGAAGSANASEGSEARITCGIPHGQPPPTVHWVLNAELIKTGKDIKATESELVIERAQKRHAGIVQCFACNALGCAYDAALLTVVPVQISDQDYSAETPKTMHIPPQPPKRHNRKNPRKHKAVLIPPSRPNVTRLSDESVMVSWSHDNHGLPIQFYKVQYREVTNSSNIQWHTENNDIPAHIHSFEIDGLTPDKYYKFRIAAVYSNQDNKLGRSSGKFYLQRGGFQSPRAPVLDKAIALSPHSIQINWTWSAHGQGVQAEGFYVYYRAVSSAGAYEKVTARGAARGLQLAHLAPDTAYELKLQAYSAQAPSDFSAILIAKTQRAAGAASSSTEAAPKGEERGPPALVTAGGAAGVAALLLLLAATLLLCRRARRPTPKEKGSPEGGANGYLPAKVPITITANPMHGEGGDGGVEMSFLHNNNCGNTTSSDDTLPHPRKNGPSTRQYV
ncbi:interference hedgehog-like [Vanessa cardui]|uniref:interference hedgehog-like n=1 Tax=Vanessa cardui TaxID=171605 RepID=UPI001F13E803|nr:interference hedgehog-like [Vanessa cardui]